MDELLGSLADHQLQITIVNALTKIIIAIINRFYKQSPNRKAPHQ